MKFTHNKEIQDDYPNNFTVCCYVDDIDKLDLRSKNADLAGELAILFESNMLRVAEISKWTEIFRRMGASPSYRPSILALHELYASRKTLPAIHPFVDFYNMISLMHMVPMGAYDVDTIEGNVNLRYAQKGEPFQPLGRPNQVEKTKNREVVYADQERVICRYWNYKDSDVTKVTSETKRAVVFADIIAESSAVAIDRAREIAAAISEGVGLDVSYELTGRD